MSICPQCGIDYGPHVELVTEMAVNDGYVLTCPLCALVKRNSIHQMPHDEPFTGEIAQRMFVRAALYLHGTVRKAGEA